MNKVNIHKSWQMGFGYFEKKVGKPFNMSCHLPRMFCFNSEYFDKKKSISLLLC